MEQGKGQRARAHPAVAYNEWMRDPGQLSSDKGAYTILSIRMLTTLPAGPWPPRSLQASSEDAALTQQRRAVNLPGGGALFKINK